MGFLNMFYTRIDAHDPDSVLHVRNLFRYIAARQGTEFSDTSALYRDPGPLKKILYDELKFHPELLRSRAYLSFMSDPTTFRALDLMKLLMKSSKNALPDPSSILPIGCMPYRYGIFSDDLYPVSENVLYYKMKDFRGSVFHVILGVGRSDAETYQLNHATRWKNLIRSEVPLLSRCFNIGIQDFCWYGAFHNKTTVKDRPHVHLVIFSRDGTPGRLTVRGQQVLLEKLEKDIVDSSPRNIYVPTSSTMARIRRKNLKNNAKTDLDRAFGQEFEPTEQMTRSIRSLMIDSLNDLLPAPSERSYQYSPYRELYRLFTKDETVQKLYHHWLKWKQENPTGCEQAYFPKAPMHVRQDLWPVQRTFLKMLESYLPLMETEEDIRVVSGDLFRTICRELTRPLLVKPEPGLVQNRFNPLKEQKQKKHMKKEPDGPEMTEQDENKETLEALEALSRMIFEEQSV